MQQGLVGALLLILFVGLISGCVGSEPRQGVVSPAPTPEGSIPIIDAHSQVDQYVELEKIIQLMDQGGVACTILSTRGKLTLEKLVSFAANYPTRIILGKYFVFGSQNANVIRL